MQIQERLTLHERLAKSLVALTDAELTDLIGPARQLHSGIGGKSSLLEIDGIAVFVKRIPLTDLEREPENYLSTRNLFALPLFYQYRLGSAGFGAWRELAALQKTTDWVKSGQCLEFPLLRHWRVLPETVAVESKEPVPSDYLEETVAYWDNSAAVKNRLEALQTASASLVLFLEYVPQTLLDGLNLELMAGGERSEIAVQAIDQILKQVTDFTSANSFVHFDAHFENIQFEKHEKPNTLFFSDFGLALAADFDLSSEEIEFLERHKHYDRCVCIHSLTKCLRAHAESQPVSAKIQATLDRYGPITDMVSAFYRALHHDKSVPWRAREVEEILGTL